MAAVRSALLSVKGVSRARVSLENKEAEVMYDPAQAKVADLVRAVNEAEGPAKPRQFRARVKS